MPPLNLYARVRFLYPFCTRDRGCSAHPAFPAPSNLRDNETQTSGVSRRENVDVYLLFDIRIDFFLVIARSFGTDRGADAGGRNKHRDHRPA